MATLTDAHKAALAHAAHWFSVLGSEHTTPADQAAWQQWCEHSPHNRWAWEQVQRLQQRLQAAPAPLTRRTLTLAEHATMAPRRSVLKGIAVALGGGLLGLGGYREVQHGGWLADYHTRTGEQITRTLADGSQVRLNTASALDVQFSASQRQLLLRKGEVLVSTAADPARRPFWVQTAHGRVQALGTRFSVRTEGDMTRVAVFEHQVRVSPEDAAPSLLGAGSQCRFQPGRSAVIEALPAGQDAWAHGVLLANDQRLDAFLAELSRYRAGWLRCDPAVAGLRISGTFAIHDTEQALRAVASALPVRIEQTTRYWVTVAAR